MLAIRAECPGADITRAGSVAAEVYDRGVVSAVLATGKDDVMMWCWLDVMFGLSVCTCRFVYRFICVTVCSMSLQ